MCGIATNTKPKKAIEDKFSAAFKAQWQPIFAAKAFAQHTLPIITNKNTNEIILAKWGLIPSFINTEMDAANIRVNTINARSETIFEKPSFKNNIINNKCLILVDGFVEYQHNNKDKQAFYIQIQNQELFAFAGIYNVWQNDITFSIVTVPANELMSEIHNSKLRMPLILKNEDEQKWLQSNSENEISNLFYQYDTNKMQAHAISNNIGKQNADLNNASILEKIYFVKQQSLF
jgi:putative SOS response-associated peptidase YedK